MTKIRTQRHHDQPMTKIRTQRHRRLPIRCRNVTCSTLLRGLDPPKELTAGRDGATCPMRATCPMPMLSPPRSHSPDPARILAGPQSPRSHSRQILLGSSLDHNAVVEWLSLLFDTAIADGRLGVSYSRKTGTSPIALQMNLQTRMLELRATYASIPDELSGGMRRHSTPDPSLDPSLALKESQSAARIPNCTRIPNYCSDTKLLLGSQTAAWIPNWCLGPRHDLPGSQI